MLLKAAVRQVYKKVVYRWGASHSAPAFLIIGTQKGGTEALRNYLIRHPYIVSANLKEINYFDQEINYHKGRHWYHSQFPIVNSRYITFEATPEYLYYPQVAERIYSYNPTIKLIVLLREPVERAYSAWNMFRTFAQSEDERKNFLRIIQRYDQPIQDALRRMVCGERYWGFYEAVADEITKKSSDFNCGLEPSFVWRGIYSDQLERFFRYFPREQILIISSKQLRQDTLTVLYKVIEFLGLPEFNWEQIEISFFHMGRYKTKIPKDAADLLYDFYRPFNEKLFNMLGYKLLW